MSKALVTARIAATVVENAPTHRRLREIYKHLAAAVQHATTSDAQAQQEQERQGQEAAAAAVVEFVGR